MVESRYGPLTTARAAHQGRARTPGSWRRAPAASIRRRACPLQRRSGGSVRCHAPGARDRPGSPRRRACRCRGLRHVQRLGPRRADPRTARRRPLGAQSALPIIDLALNSDVAQDAAGSQGSTSSASRPSGSMPRPRRRHRCSRPRTSSRGRPRPSASGAAGGRPTPPSSRCARTSWDRRVRRAGPGGRKYEVAEVGISRSLRQVWTRSCTPRRCGHRNLPARVSWMALKGSNSGYTTLFGIDVPVAP